MMATVGDPADPVITHTSKIRGTELTSSSEEEKAALLLEHMISSLFVSD